MSAPSRVSVVMPAFNAANTIGAAISGVLTQTHPDIELIVIDDGSSDETLAICRAHGDRIVVLEGEHGGSARARNLGLAHATGDYIAFCDADDVLLPSYVAKSLALLEGQTRRIVTHDAIMLTPAGVAHGQRLVGIGPPPAADQRLAILQDSFVSIFSVFHRSLIDDIGPFREDLTYSEDWEFWIRAVLAGWTVISDGDAPALCRWSETSKSAHVADHYRTEDAVMELIRAEHWDHLSQAERHFLDVRRTLGPPRELDLRGRLAIREGHHAEARRLYRTMAQVPWINSRLNIKAKALAWVPGSTYVWGRVRRIREERSGRRGTVRI